MTIEIHIDCESGGEAKLLGGLLPALSGLSYRINVTGTSVTKGAAAARKRPVERKTPVVSPYAENGKNQPLGKNKRAVYAAYAKNPERLYNLDETLSISGLKREQARSVLVDGSKRGELEPKTINDINHYKLTSKGIQRLSLESNQTTQERPKAA